MNRPQQVPLWLELLAAALAGAGAGAISGLVVRSGNYRARALSGAVASSLMTLAWKSASYVEERTSADELSS